LFILTLVNTQDFFAAVAGLPDVFFSNQKSQFGYILEDLGMENVVIYSGHLEYCTTTGCILWAFGNFVVIWYIFS
jgi:hypothetical protein